jgi:hypothetical protein
MGLYPDDDIVQSMNQRNRRRQKLQRIGLSLLMLSVLLGALSVVFD